MLYRHVPYGTTAHTNCSCSICNIVVFFVYTNAKYLLYTMIFTFLIYLVPVTFNLIDAAKILGVFHVGSYSHYQLGHELFKQLARRGHEVTFITPIEENEEVKNLRTIVLYEAYKKFLDRKINYFKFSSQNLLYQILVNDGAHLTESILNDTNVQNLIKSNETFDIVIFDRLYNDAFHGFCAHFKSHCILSLSSPIAQYADLQMGNSVPPSYVPIYKARFSSNMNFFERAYNAIGYLVTIITFHFNILPVHNEVMHRYFPNMPDLSSIYKNISLMLVNSHTATNPATPFLPNIIDVGGYHIKPPTRLPKDIKDYLDESKEGVVLFSLGSNLQSQHLPIAKREILFKVFEKLHHNVLFKWENDSMPERPINVKLTKWIPQNDVIGHRNVRLFVTHGGLLSTLEATYHGVPMLGIPVFADQYYNMKYAEETGNAIVVPYNDLTESSLATAIKFLLRNPKYLKNAKAKSIILRDNPTKQLDKAIFWIEYVLRHNGAPHLRAAALNITLWQYLLLDVIGIIILVTILPILVYRRMYKNNNTKVRYYKKEQ